MATFYFVFAAVVCSLAANGLTTSSAVAQNSKAGMPRDPETKAGKCAKANGGTFYPNRGWYTNDRVGYLKCMSK